MPDTYVKKSGSWKAVNELYVKSGGAWKTVQNGYVKDGGSWKKFFERAVSVIISTDQEEVSLTSLAQSAGWDGSSPVVVNCTVQSGVVIGTPVVNTERPAFLISGFPSGSEITLTNNGVIVGKFGVASGGHGGHALKVRDPITLVNNGTIAGGGGGGGDGSDDSDFYMDGVYNPENGLCHYGTALVCSGTGGNGGRGAGWYSTGNYYSAGANGTAASNQTCTGATDTSGDPIFCEGTSYTTTAEDGGNGGGLGSNGGNGGGSRGRAVDGHSYVTYSTTGTILGSQVN